VASNERALARSRGNLDQRYAKLVRENGFALQSFT
jgi:hypothetical protein